MAKGQKKQKGGRNRKIALDLTSAELQQFDHMRAELSRSDFLSVILAWWMICVNQFASTDDAILFYDLLTGADWRATRDGNKFKIEKYELPES